MRARARTGVRALSTLSWITTQSNPGARERVGSRVCEHVHVAVPVQKIAPQVCEECDELVVCEPSKQRIKASWYERMSKHLTPH